MSILDVDIKLSSNIKSNLKEKDGWERSWWGASRYKNNSDHWIWQKNIIFDTDVILDYENYYIEFIYFPEDFEGYAYLENLENKYKYFHGAIKNKLYVHIKTLKKDYEKLYNINSVMDINIITSTYINIGKKQKITKNCII